MFKPKVESLGYHVDELLSKSGVQLQVIPGTELESLMLVSADSAGRDTTQMLDLANVNKHDVCLAKLTEMAAGAVKAVVYRTRSVVRPVIDEAIKRMELAAEENVSKTLTYDIVQKFPHDIYNNAALEAVIEEYVNGPLFEEKMLPEQLRPILDDDLMPWCRIGVASLDRDLESLVKEKESSLQDIYNIIFSSPANSFATVLAERHGQEGVLLGFALLRGIIINSEEIDNITPASIGFLRYALGTLGAAIAKESMRQTRELTHGRLIQSVEGNTIVVNPDVYRTFLERDGTPEAVMGAGIVGDAFNAQKILDNKVAYERTYATTMRFNENEITGARREAMLQALRSYLCEELKNDEAWAGRLSDMLKAVNHEVGLMSLNVSDPYPATAVVVNRVLFPNTPCLRILQSIDSHLAKDGSLNVNEAATLAQVDYVCEWLNNQVTVCDEAKTQRLLVTNMIAVAEAVLAEVCTNQELASTIVKSGAELNMVDVCAGTIKNKLIVRV